MPLEGEYEPNPTEWVREHVELYESSGGTEGVERDGRRIVVVTTRGAKTGKLRKNPVMRVEHNGAYAIVASRGGAPTNPVWVNNLRAEPRLELQDGPVKQDMVAREVSGTERDKWWERSVAAFPNYGEYQTRTDRLIPVFIAEAV